MLHTRIGAVGLSVALVLTGCGNKNESPVGSMEPGAEAKASTAGLSKQDVSGQAQKGPFATGTRVNIAELDEQLVQTGRSFATTLKDSKGSFTVRGVSLDSPFARVEIDGYYFDEVKGQLSDNRLALFSYVDLSNQATANVNILGHLEAARLEHLVANDHLKFAAAQAQAHEEVLSVFQFDPGKVGPAAGLDLSQRGAGNAALFAMSIILQGERSVGELSELLSKIQNDLSEDGNLDEPELAMTLKESAVSVDVDAARDNLAGQFEGLGVAAEVPDATEGVSSFVESMPKGNVPTGGVGPMASAAPAGTAARASGERLDPAASAGGAVVNPGDIKPADMKPGAEVEVGGPIVGPGGISGAASAAGPGGLQLPVDPADPVDPKHPVDPVDPKHPPAPSVSCSVAPCPCVGSEEPVPANYVSVLGTYHDADGSSASISALPDGFSLTLTCVRPPMVGEDHPIYAGTTLNTPEECVPGTLRFKSSWRGDYEPSIEMGPDSTGVDIKCLWPDEGTTVVTVSDIRCQPIAAACP